MKRNGKSALWPCLFALSLAGAAMAQEQPEGGGQADDEIAIEELIVTGSRVFSQGQTASPLVQVTVEEFYDNPAITLSEFMRENVTANHVVDLDLDESNQSGQRNTGNRSAGANLWGLGEENTLTLLNGSPVINYAAPDRGGWYTSDINSLIPGIAMSRVDILLDGGGAIYGTQAVSGVINLVPRYSFRGLEVRAQTDFFPEGESFTDLGSSAMEGLFGTELADGQGSLIAAFDYRRTRQLDAVDVGRNYATDVIPYDPAVVGIEEFDEIYGNPGNAYEWTAGGRRNSVTLIDPLCGMDIEDVEYLHEGILAPPGTAGEGTCVGYGGRELSGQNSTRYSLFSAVQWEFSEAVTGNLEVAYAKRENSNRREYNTVTGLVVGSTNQINGTVPVDHPARLYYNSIDPAWNRVRRTAVDGSEGPPPGWRGNELQESDTFNFHGSLDIQLNDSLDLSLGATYGRSRVTQHQYDVIVDRYENALAGLGGPGCNPAAGTPGEGNCQYFNPFLSSLLPNADTVFAGGSLANDPALVDWFFPNKALQRFFETDLRSFNATLNIATGILLPGGEILAVVGAERREDTSAVDFNENTKSDGVISTIGTGQTPYKGEDDTNSAFFEAALPILDNLTMQAAGRYDDYSRHGSTFNPKVGFSFDATDNITLRGSWGTSFRAPTIAQQTPIISRGPIGPRPTGSRRGGLTLSLVTQPAPDLRPQESTHWSLGFDASLLENAGALQQLDFSASYVNIDFQDRIDSTRAIDKSAVFLGNNPCATTTDLNGDGTWEWGVFYTTEDSDLDGVPDGALPCWGGNDPDGDGIIQFADLTHDYGNYVNLLATKMEGINFLVSSQWDTPAGPLSVGLNATWALTFDFQDRVEEPLQDFIGLQGLGFATTSNIREWRGNVPIRLRWNNGSFMDGHSTSLTARFDTDIENAAGVVTSGGITTWDLRYSFSLSENYSLSFTVRNIFGEEREDPTPAIGAGDRAYLVQLTYSPGN